MTLHLHPVPASCLASSPAQQALELGQLIIGTSPLSPTSLHRHYDVLSSLSAYAQRLAQQMSDESCDERDEEFVETFDIFATMVSDEVLPALERFLTRQEERTSAHDIYWRGRDISRKLT